MVSSAPDVTAIVRQMLLVRTGAEPLEMGSQMFEVARTMVLASLPPGLSDLEIKRRLCERL